MIMSPGRVFLWPWDTVITIPFIELTILYFLLMDMNQMTVHNKISFISGKGQTPPSPPGQPAWAQIGRRLLYSKSTNSPESSRGEVRSSSRSPFGRGALRREADLGPKCPWWRRPPFRSCVLRFGRDRLVPGRWCGSIWRERGIDAIAVYTLIHIKPFLCWSWIF